MKFLFVFLLLMVSSSSFTACGSSVDANDEPEFPDADFVWRVCNEHEEYAMEELNAMAVVSLGEREYRSIGELLPQKCTTYFPGFDEGTRPVYWLLFEQNDKEYTVAYLEVYYATRGLIDSTSINDAPGRYTYHANYESTRMQEAYIEVEREANH